MGDNHDGSGATLVVTDEDTATGDDETCGAVGVHGRMQGSLLTARVQMETRLPL